MDAIEKGTYSIRRVNKSWNTPMNSLVNHLNGRTISKKMGLGSMLTKEEDAVVITLDISNAKVWTIH
jgi:hypothetical protein